MVITRNIRRSWTWGIGVVLVAFASCDGPTSPPSPPVGSISGDVTAEGRGLDGVTVSLSDGTVTTTAEGSFRFDRVTAGTYQVSISGYPEEAEFGSTSLSVTVGTEGGLATVTFGGQTSNTDRDALVALYDSTDGGNWTNNDNWLTTAPLGDWHGVTTDANGRVTALWLQENNLRGTIPAAVGGLTQLDVLALFREPDLTGPIPSELGNLANLRLLALGGNDLTGTIPPELGNLSHLTGLYLWGNGLTGTIPPELGNLTSLQALQLDGRSTASAATFADAGPGAQGSRSAGPSAQELAAPYHYLGLEDDQESAAVAASQGNVGLTGQIPPEFRNLTGLTLFTLGHNRLTGGIPSWIGNFTRLEEFAVHNNQLTGGIPQEIANLGDLELFWAANNNLSGSIPPEIGNLDALTRLGLHDNSLTGNIPPALGDLTSLVQLTLSRNALVGTIPGDLGDLGDLEVLYLNQNRLTGGVPSELGDLNSLVSLSLRDNELTGTLPDEIGDLSNLVRLWVYGNPMSGPLPLTMTKLANLTLFNFSGTRLCVPDDQAFVSWLQSVQDVTGSGLDCGRTANDRAALVALYNATRGANWTNSTNWVTDAPLDDWYGVTTDASERVVGLDLEENNLIGPIPRELGDLAKLETLVLVDSLTGPIPGELGSLGNLKSLVLIGLGLTGPIPPELGHLASLETLALAGPGLTGSIPPQLGSLAGLEALILVSTALTGPIPSELGNLANLTRLFLSDNELNGSIPSELGNLASLTELVLNGNALSGSLPPALGNLSQLEYLALHDNLLTGPVPDSFLSLDQLQALSIARNSGLCFPDTPAFRSWLQGMDAEIEGLFCQNAGDRAALVALYETTGGASWKNNENWLTDAPLGEWAGVATDSLGRVTGLFLESNNLISTLPPELGSLAHLVYVDLGYNDLTGALPDSFLGLAQLEHFYFWVNDGLCAPATNAFTTWLSGNNSYGPRCGQQNDYAALLELYDATRGADWTNDQGWLTAAPLGDWHGVTIDSSGRVSSLILQENNLTGPVPPELGDLANLTHLDLNNNDLTDSIPSELDKLTDLEHLDLWNNSLTGTIPPQLGSLAKLTFLGLTANSLNGPIPPELGNLTSLTRMYLWQNELSGPVPDSFLQLQQLDSFYTDSRNCVPASTAFRTWLQGINNHDATLCNAADRAVLVALYEATDGGNWTNSANWLTDAPLGDWYGVVTDVSGRIVTLGLQQNQLTGAIPPALGNLSSLRNLNLRGNRLVGPIPRALGNLAELRTLHLEDNSLTGLLPSTFLTLERLAQIYFSANNGLCVPYTDAFSEWLAAREYVGPRCNQHHGDYTALAALYEATTGAEWSNNDRWLTDAPLSDWYGVQTDAEGRVTVVSLPYNNLVGSLPSEIGHLDRLFALSLPYNALTDSIPPSIGQLTRLLTLDLSRNVLYGPIPSLHNLAQLFYLNLNDNLLSGPIPNSLTYLADLTYLYLSNNELEGRIPPRLIKLKKLEVFHVDGNQRLWGPLPTWLRHLPLDDMSFDGTSLCIPHVVSSDPFRWWLYVKIGSEWWHDCRKSRAMVTQATTSLPPWEEKAANMVPLIAGDSALVRVFVADSVIDPIGSRRLPSAIVRFYVGKTEIHSLNIAAPGGWVPQRVDIGNKDKSLNVVVPGWVVQPGLEMVVELDPNGEESSWELIPPQQFGRLAVDVVTVPRLRIALVPFVWRRDPSKYARLETGAKSFHLKNDDQFFDHVKTLLPVRDTDFRVYTRPAVWTNTEPTVDNRSELLDELEVLQRVERGKGYPWEADVYVGWVARGSDDIAGAARLGKPIAVTTGGYTTLAHEIGHTMGLKHAPCNESAIEIRNVDDNYPNANGIIGTWGYNLGVRVTLGADGIKPNSVVHWRTRDLMSYCSPKWIGHYSFKRALSNVRSGIWGDATTTTVHSLLLWGGVNESGRLELRPSFVVRMAPEMPGGSGPYRLVGRDGDAGEIFVHRFQMSNDGEGGRKSFLFAVPMGEDWTERLTEIELSGPEGSVVTKEDDANAAALLWNEATGVYQGLIRNVPEARLLDEFGGLGFRIQVSRVGGK